MLIQKDSFIFASANIWLSLTWALKKDINPAAEFMGKALK